MPEEVDSFLNIRGWLEGSHEHLALIRDHIIEQAPDEWLNFLWTFPRATQPVQGYVFLGGYVSAASVDWFVAQLQEFAAMAPPGDDRCIRGLFIATDTADLVRVWQVRHGQATEMPGDPQYAYLAG